MLTTRSLHFRRGPCTVSSWNKPCVSLLKGNNILTLYKTWIKIINVHSMDINMTWFADIKTFFTDRGTSASFKHMWTLLLTTFFFFYVYSYNPTVRRLVWTHQEKKKTNLCYFREGILAHQVQVIGDAQLGFEVISLKCETCKRKEKSEIMPKMPGHVLSLPKNQQVNKSFYCWFGQATNTLSNETLQVFLDAHVYLPTLTP